MTNLITFNAKNLTGDVQQISYKNVDEISILLSNVFETSPLHEPVWMDAEGNENFPPKNTETVYVLFRYINVPVKFIYDWRCIDVNHDNYREITLLIESVDMKYVYQEIAISFFMKKTDYEHRFYSEKVRINIIDEDRCSLTKYISIPDETPYFTRIKDLFLSFKDDFMEIPEEFYGHLAECVENIFYKYYNL
jgi:hypothetical protein